MSMTGQRENDSISHHSLNFAHPDLVQNVTVASDPSVFMLFSHVHIYIYTNDIMHLQP